MKAPVAMLSVAAVMLVLVGCGSGRPASAGGLHSAAYRALPRSLQVFIRSKLARPNDGRTDEVDVYGPGTHAALERAAMGDIVNDPERQKDFYLLVLHGRYVCSDCSGPAPAGAGQTKPPHSTLETSVWSERTGETDDGFGGSLPSAMSSLHPLAVIVLP